jgi:hypothetical protein
MGVFVVGKSLSPTKLATFHFGDSFVCAYTGKEADWLDGAAQVASNNNRYALVGDEGVTTLDELNLKPVSTIPRKDLPALDWSSVHVAFSDADEAFLWAQAKDNSQDIALYRAVPSDEGYDIVASAVLEQGFVQGYTRNENDERLHIGPNGDVVWQGDDRVFLLDGESLKIEREIPAGPGNAIDCVGNGADTVLICERDAHYEEMTGTYRLVDKSTGKDIPSKVQEYSYFVPLAAISDITTLSYRKGISTGSIIWPIRPSPMTSTGLRYLSARSKASCVSSTASWTEEGARTSIR